MSTQTHTENETGFAFYRDGRKARASQYGRVRDAAEYMLTSPDPKHRSLIKAENEGLLRIREVQPGAVQDNRFLSNLSIQYANDDYIGEQLMPVAPTPALAGEFPIYDKRSRLAAPDDSMAGRTTANEISDSRSTDTYSCKGYALKNHVDVLTLRNQVAPLDEMVDLTESVAELIALRRELRIAAKVTDSTQYAAANQATIVAGQRWNDAGGGNPVKDIQNAVAAIWNGHGPTELIGWTSLDVWNPLSRNPAILDLFKYGGTAPGLATPDMICKFFGLDGMLVSKARKDTANLGQTASYSRIWGNFFGVLRVARRATIRNAGWGSTFRFGQQLTRVWYDPKVSTEGGYEAQVSTHEDHKVTANDTGFLILTPTT